MVQEEYEDATNWRAWAVGKKLPRGGFRVRKIVWGRLLARAEKRDGETCVAAAVMIRARRDNYA